MAEGVKIPVSAPGADKTKADLDQVRQSVGGIEKELGKVGDSSEKASSSTASAFSRIKGVFTDIRTVIAGGILVAVASLIGKVTEFFDKIDERCREAVNNLTSVRREFTNLFEAMDAYSEEQRQAVTKSTLDLLAQSRISKAEGLPVINEYYRQFRPEVEAGKITEPQYRQGLTGMLGYAARHGAAGTTDIIQLMAGFGMVTPQQQGIFRRQVSAAAGAGGLQEEEVAAALSRGLPTIKAMGWTPQQALEAVAVLAKGEAGRKRTMMPAQVIEALARMPDAAKLEDLGLVSKETGMLFAETALRGRGMAKKDYFSMLQQVYGPDAAAGILKLQTAQMAPVSAAIRKAGGPAGMREEAAQEAARMGTMEAEAATTETGVDILQQQVTEEDRRKAMRKAFQDEYKKKQQREHPFLYGFTPLLLTQWIERRMAAEQYMEYGIPPPVIINKTGELNIYPTVGPTVKGPRVNPGDVQ